MEAPRAWPAPSGSWKPSSVAAKETSPPWAFPSVPGHSVLCLKPLFFFLLRFCLFMRDRDRERERQRQKEQQAPRGAGRWIWD